MPHAKSAKVAKVETVALRPVLQSRAPFSMKSATRAQILNPSRTSRPLREAFFL